VVDEVEDVVVVDVLVVLEELEVDVLLVLEVVDVVDEVLLLVDVTDVLVVVLVDDVVVVVAGTDTVRTPAAPWSGTSVRPSLVAEGLTTSIRYPAPGLALAGIATSRLPTCTRPPSGGDRGASQPTSTVSVPSARSRLGGVGKALVKTTASATCGAPPSGTTVRLNWSVTTLTPGSRASTTGSVTRSPGPPAPSATLTVLSAGAETTIVPDMTAPWTVHKYPYVPGTENWRVKVNGAAWTPESQLSGPVTPVVE